MAKIKAFGIQVGPEGCLRYGIETPIDDLNMALIGGRGSGKTASGTLRMMNYMLANPGSSGMITAPVNDRIRDTILPSVYKFFSLAGLRPGEDYDYNKNDRELTVMAGGAETKAYLRTTERPERLPGPDLSWVWMDEARLSPEEAYSNLMPTLRQPGYPHQFWTTTTAMGRRHWTTKFFSPENYVLDEDEELPEREEGHIWKMYKARTIDNPFGGAALEKKLAATYGRGSLMYRQEALGEFVMHEGLVYPDFRREYHVRPVSEWPTQPKDMWHVVAGVDFGFRNPSAIIVEGIDHERRRYIMDEVYQTRLTQDAIVREAKRVQEKYHIELFLCDSQDPRMIRAMKFAGLPAVKAIKNVGSKIETGSGIGLCTQALNQKVEGEQGFFVAPNCLKFMNEAETFVMNEAKENQNPDERPRQFGNHCLAAGTLIETAYGGIPIENVRVGDYVLTRQGYHPVIASGITELEAHTYTVTMDDGRELVATGDHPVWVDGAGWVNIEYLQAAMQLEVLWTPASTTNRRAVDGARNMDLSQRDTISTTKTAIQPTMTCPTLSVCQAWPIMASTRNGHAHLRDSDTLPILGRLPKSGTPPKMAESGTDSMLRTGGMARSQNSTPVSTVEKSSILQHSGPSSVTLTVNRKICGGEGTQDMSPIVTLVVPGGRRKNPSYIYASSVEKNSSPRPTGQDSAAPLALRKLTISSLKLNPNPQPVYNLTVANVPEFYANGILVHNCMDSWRYAENTIERYWGKAPRKYAGSLKVRLA